MKALEVIFRPFALLLEKDYEEDAVGRSSFALGLVITFAMWLGAAVCLIISTVTSMLDKE